MSPEFNAAAAFAIAAVATFLVTPVAIAIAIRTKFYDLPAGYKGHKSPTPYLGGTAIIVGILAAVLLVQGAASTHWVIIAGAIAIWAMGTLDDKFNLPISFRTLVEAGIAVLLWATGRGWLVFHNGPADLALTVVWVVGVMNAFNLMDNMDGAAASTAAVSAIGAGALALITGDHALAALSFAVAGACFGFLPRNLARPARIFMGDGGSLLVGLLVARVTMAAVSPGYLGPSGVIIAGLLVALVIFDTSLVHDLAHSRRTFGAGRRTRSPDPPARRPAGRAAARRADARGRAAGAVRHHDRRRPGRPRLGAAGGRAVGDRRRDSDLAVRATGLVRAATRRRSVMPEQVAVPEVVAVPTDGRPGLLEPVAQALVGTAELARSDTGR